VTVVLYVPVNSVLFSLRVEMAFWQFDVVLTISTVTILILSVLRYMSGDKEKLPHFVLPLD
jgi:hypothetical protein